MKTYIISTSAFGKSIPNYFQYLAEYLNKRGSKVIIIFDHHHEYVNQESSIIYKTWPSKRPTKLKDFLYLISLIKEFKPDVIIGQFGSTNVNLIVGRLFRVPNRIIYWHTMFEQLRIDSTASKIKQSFQHWLKRNLIEHCCTLVMTNSEATKEDLTKKYKNTTNILVSNYLIPDPFNSEIIKSKNQRESAISFVARLDKSKGHSKIIDEIPDLLTFFPSMKLYLVGEGKERINLEKKCQYLEIQKNVVFTGAVNLSEVYNHMENSLIHISASEEEAFGLVNAEALAAGTPIIANKVGGIKDILLENTNGLFLKPYEKGSLKYLVRNIINNWESFSKNARQSFLDRYDANEDIIAMQITNLEKALRPIKYKR